MKTNQSTTNYYLKWESFLTVSGFAVRSFFYWLLAQLQSSISDFKMTVRVAQAQPVIRSVKRSIPLSNNRIFIGLSLGLVSPLLTCVHMLPGMKEEVSKEWFYGNYHDLLLVEGPYFFCAAICFVAFVLTPRIEKRIKFSRWNLKIQLTRFLSIPAAFFITKIIWLFNIETNDQFDTFLVPAPYWIAGLIIGYSLIRALDYLVWRQEHVMNALLDSLEGLHQIDVDQATLKEKSFPIIQELRQFNSKY